MKPSSRQRIPARALTARICGRARVRRQIPPKPTASAAGGEVEQHADGPRLGGAVGSGLAVCWAGLVGAAEYR